MVPNCKASDMSLCHLMDSLYLVRNAFYVRYCWFTMHTASGIPRRTLIIHGALTIVLPYLNTRLRSHALSHAWPDAPSADSRRKVWGVLTALESSYGLLGLVSFIVFLWDGRYCGRQVVALLILLPEAYLTATAPLSTECSDSAWCLQAVS